MKLIYTHPNRLIVENIKNVLENAGLKVQLQNQYAGGGVGELAPIDAWPEVWLERERDELQANALIEKIKTDAESEWQCSNCGETNAGSFEVCWSCNFDRQHAD